MTYIPKVNHYVRWRRLEGWVYYVDELEEYLTIEIGTTPKDEINIQCCPIHRKYHCLVLCYHQSWNELEYVTERLQ